MREASEVIAALAQEIRRVDGDHTLGAAALAEALMPFIASLPAATPPAGVGELDRSAPPKVWLQVDTDGDDEDRSEPIPRENWSDLTWCYEPIGGQEVVYIRADLATPQPASSVMSNNEGNIDMSFVSVGDAGRK